MSEEIGEATIRIKSDDTGFSTGVEGSLGKLGGLAAKAGVGMAAGLGVGAAAAGKSFAQFDGQIREVFTLMPGMSQEAMDAMSGDVLQFSRDFGVLPDTVIPALYDSLSAGVPADNVFTFLETSQKFAAAGATDVSTAVDGLTTVVNAFGMDASEAGAAADVMFTAVKQGKTTVPELSASMFQVAPIAAAMGVSLEEVAGGFATLTAQGVPTSVAATQMKGAIAELATSGSKADQAFTQITGQTFPEFMASGGSMQDAFNAMAEGAEAQGLSVNNLFGSIDAGSAVLGMTGANAESFANNLAAMGDSAGAVGEAFEVMDQGIGPAFNRMKATAVTSMIEIGDALAPAIEGLFNGIVQYLPVVTDILQNRLIPAIATTAEWLGANLLPIFQEVGAFIMSDIVPAIQGFVTSLQGGLGGEGSSVITKFKDLFTDLAPKVVGAFQAIITIVGQVIEVATLLWGAFGDEIITVVIASIKLLVSTIASILDIVMGVFNVIIGVITGDWARAWVGFKQIFGGVWDLIVARIQFAWAIIGAIFSAIGSAVAGVFSGVWGLLAGAVSAAWDAIVGFVSAGATAVGGFITAAWDMIKAATSTAWNFIVNLTTTVWSAVAAVIGAVWSAIVTAVSAALNAIMAVVTAIWNAIVAVITAVLNAILAVVTAVWNFIVTAITNYLNLIQAVVTTVWNAILAGITVVLNAIQTVITTVWNAILAGITVVLNAIQTVITTVWNAIQTAITTILNAIKSVIETVWNAIKAFISTTLEAIKTIITTAWNNIKANITTALNAIKSTVTTIWNGIKSAVTTAVNNILRVVTDKFGQIKSKITEAINGAKTSFVNGVNAMKAPIQGVVDKIQSLIDKIKNIPKPSLGGLTSWIPGVGADGGLFTSATNMIIGEAGPEVLLPLTRPARMVDLLSDPVTGGLVSAALQKAGRGGPGIGAESTTGANVADTGGGSTAQYVFNGVDLGVALQQAERRERRRMTLGA